MKTGQQVMDLVCAAAWREAPAGTPMFIIRAMYLARFGDPSHRCMQDEDYDELVKEHGIV